VVAVVSVLLMGSIVRLGEIPCYSADVIKTPLDITENSDVDTVSLREWIAKHSDHLDAGIHELQQQITALTATVEGMAAKVDTIHADVEAARPMVERWRHSMIGKLAKGAMPWSHT
jgi:hypothetical protein